MITDAGGFYLKHMEERHLGLAPKCLVAKKKTLEISKSALKNLEGGGETDVKKLRQDDIRCHVSSFKVRAKRKSAFLWQLIDKSN